MSYSISHDEALRRVKALERHRHSGGTGQGFYAAAQELSIPIATLKAWARRNTQFVPPTLYEDNFILTEGERLARHHSLKKATDAAAKSKRRTHPERRPGKVTVLPAQPEWKLPSAQEIVNQFIENITTLQTQNANLSSHALELGDQISQLQLRVSELETELEQRRQVIKSEADLRVRLEEAGLFPPSR